MTINLITILIKMISLHKISYNSRNQKVIKLDLSNYATKSGVEKATRDICNLATKGDLSSLKARKNKLDEDKPKMVPADLSKPNNVIDDNVVKKDVHGKLIAKINSIGTKLPTDKLSPKTQYD